MTRIFISYRRDDTLGLTGRIFDRLKSHFGAQSVLMDIDSIPVGVDFRQYITDAITKCNAMLAIIGDRWLRSASDTKSRLDNPSDFVRLEIESALRQGRSIVPVLIGNTLMPSEDQLPVPLKNLCLHKRATD
jgi:TIR domain-containing protein